MPASETTFTVRPSADMPRAVPMTHTGMASPTTAADRKLRRKTISTSTARIPPTMRFWRTRARAPLM